MAMDPSMMGGVAPPQGVSATQTMAPPQAGAPMPSQGGPPLDPTTGQPMVQQAPPPKPPSLIPADVAKLLAEAVNNVKMEAAKGLTNYLGDPRGNVNVKNRDLLKVWRKRNPDIDPLYEKLVNKRSDDEIMEMMYPARRALIRYGRRTYTEQVDFAEYMAKLDQDPRYDDITTTNDDGDDEYIPPQSRFPSRGEESYKDDLLREMEAEREPQSEE